MRWFLLLTLTGFIHAGDWPSFRGPDASGVADGKEVPVDFDGPSGKKILWKAPVPGLAHASPIVLGNRLIVASAVSGQQEQQLKLGLYGSGEAADDMDEQRWTLTCFDKTNGKQLWHTEVFRGKPRAKRHIKATHCNATPAGNDRYIVAMMGSEGLFCTDLDGKLL
ncbi:MAG: PQQ-like beta-propeller repeat protein, partial [Pseudomonadales bacterium]|nr:PQQ-like beta-propeller repeat protein [Pseudomonadales bacterium]